MPAAAAPVTPLTFCPGTGVCVCVYIYVYVLYTFLYIYQHSPSLNKWWVIKLNYLSIIIVWLYVTTIKNMAWEISLIEYWFFSISVLEPQCLFPWMLQRLLAQYQCVFISLIVFCKNGFINTCRFMKSRKLSPDLVDFSKCAEYSPDEVCFHFCTYVPSLQTLWFVVFFFLYLTVIFWWAPCTFYLSLEIAFLLYKFLMAFFIWAFLRV